MKPNSPSGMICTFTYHVPLRITKFVIFCISHQYSQVDSNLERLTFTSEEAFAFLMHSALITIACRDTAQHPFTHHLRPPLTQCFPNFSHFAGNIHDFYHILLPPSLLFNIFKDRLFFFFNLITTSANHYELQLCANF